MPETGMVALARMLRERAEQLGFHLSSRKSFEAANALVLTGAADPSNLSYADLTGEEAVHNVLSFYLARTGSLSGRAA